MRILIPVLISVALAAVIGPAEGASAVPATGSAAHSMSVRHYKNCTAVHAVYSGGIAKAGVTRNKIGTRSKPLKGHVLYSGAAYAAVKKLDRDRDGIACEKS